MDELLNVLQKINPNIDFEHEENLIESGQLDSMDIVAIIDTVQSHFGINLDGNDIEADNFISLKSLWNMIRKYLN